MTLLFITLYLILGAVIAGVLITVLEVEEEYYVQISFVSIIGWPIVLIVIAFVLIVTLSKKVTDKYAIKLKEYLDSFDDD